ncbi:helix-turn-helix domain-containing protein [Halovulum sp. GXIMD14794]
METSWIKARLSETGRTQAELAAHLRVSEATMSKILSGHRRLLADDVVRIRSFFGEAAVAASASAPPLRIAELRAERGMTQGDLAARVGLEQATISRIETGRRDTSGSVLASIAAALAVPVAALFDPDAPVPPGRSESDVEEAYRALGQVISRLAGSETDRSSEIAALASARRILWELGQQGSG